MSMSAPTTTITMVTAMVVAVWAVTDAAGDFTVMGDARRWAWLLAAIAAGAGAYGAMLLALGLRPRHLRH